MAALATSRIDPIRKLAILDNLHDFHTCEEGLGIQLGNNLKSIKEEQSYGGWEGDYVEAILNNAILKNKITEGECKIYKNIKRSNVDKEKKKQGICNPYYETTMNGIIRIDVKDMFDSFFEINKNTAFTTCHDASYGANNFEKKWGEYNQHTLLKIPQNTWDSALAVKSSCMTKSKFKVYFPSDNNNKTYTFTSNKLTKDSNFTISFKKKNTIFSRLNNESNSVNLLDKYSGEKIKLKIKYSGSEEEIEFKSLGKIKYIVKNIKKVIKSIKKKITRKKKQPKPKEKEINETGVTRNELCIISGGNIGEDDIKEIKPNTLAFKLGQILEQIKKKVTKIDYNNLLMDIKRTGDWEQVLGTKKYQQKNPNEKVIFFTGDALCFLYAVYNNINCALFVRTKLIMYKTSGNLNSVNSKLLNEYFTSAEPINKLKSTLIKQNKDLKRIREAGASATFGGGGSKVKSMSKDFKYREDDDDDIDSPMSLLINLLHTFLIRVVFVEEFKKQYGNKTFNFDLRNKIIKVYDTEENYNDNSLKELVTELKEITEKNELSEYKDKLIEISRIIEDNTKDSTKVSTTEIFNIINNENIKREYDTIETKFNNLNNDYMENVVKTRKRPRSNRNNTNTVSYLLKPYSNKNKPKRRKTNNSTRKTNSRKGTNSTRKRPRSNRNNTNTVSYLLKPYSNKNKPKRRKTNNSTRKTNSRKGTNSTRKRKRDTNNTNSLLAKKPTLSRLQPKAPSTNPPPLLPPVRGGKRKKKTRRRKHKNRKNKLNKKNKRTRRRKHRR